MKSINTPTTWLLSATACLILSASHLLDKIPDHRSDWAASQSLIDAQKQAEADARKEKAARAICKEYGEAVPTWDFHGQLDCKARRK
jgi:hypothetical protein